MISYTTKNKDKRAKGRRRGKIYDREKQDKGLYKGKDQIKIINVVPSGF